MLKRVHHLLDGYILHLGCHEYLTEQSLDVFFLIVGHSNRLLGWQALSNFNNGLFAELS